MPVAIRPDGPAKKIFEATFGSKKRKRKSKYQAT